MNVTKEESPVYRCKYSGKTYRSISWHVRSCDECGKDQSAGMFVAVPLDMQAGIPPEGTSNRSSSVGPSAHVPRIVEIDSVGESVEAPKFPQAAQVADAMAPRRQYFTHEAVGALFEMPLELLTSARKEGAELDKPRMDQKRLALLEQIWTPYLNDLMLRIAGKRPELAFAIIMTIIIYPPYLFQAKAYRDQQRGKKQYATDSKRGLEEVGLVKKVDPADVDQDAFAEKVKDRMAGK